MKKFKFNLVKLLEFRQFHERQAEMDLAQKSGVCAQLNLKLGDIALAKSNTMQARAGTEPSIFDLRASELYLVRMERDRVRTEKTLAQAEIQREIARKTYVEAKISRTVLDKLKERRELEYYKVTRAKEQFDLDDLANVRYGR